MGNFEFIAKMVISVIAVLAFVVPEPASSIVGVVILGAVWGVDVGQ